MTTPDSKSAPAAQRAMQEFLTLAAAPPAPGAGIPDNATPLLKNLWFSWNRKRIGFAWLLKKRCQRLRPRMQLLLEWALTECYALSGLPAPACVDLAVEHAKKQGGREAAGFVNAVLRKLLREAPDAVALEALLKDAPPAIRCNLPDALYERWKAAHGAEWTAQLATLLQQPATVTARLRGSLAALPSPMAFEEAAATLQESPEEFQPAEYYLQDASTLLAPSLLDPRPGEVIGDLCAAPGGKSVAIAERLRDQGRLYSFDSAPGRLDRLRENLAGCPIAVIEVQDAAHPTLPAASLDGVLLDVPCSNTGVIRRRPDVRRNFSLAHLQKLCKLQREILEGACQLVKAGGRLVYSTCSIEDDENILQVQAFLAKHPEFSLEGHQQLYPTESHDGAFAARLVKR
ncbi:MAG: hypothetical protein MJ202_03905 [Lentisphaeria bacterium]|nr:hypothetical protein [Lentisphaeria bacterium]